MPCATAIVCTTSNCGAKIQFLDALGTQRIPNPTTAGDFCRCFQAVHINILQDTFDYVRVGLWQQQPDPFFDRATIDGGDALHVWTPQGR
jgi:hypothetical protein